MKRVIVTHRWFAFVISLVLLLGFSFSYAVISDNDLAPRLFTNMQDEGGGDSTAAPGDSMKTVDLPYKYEDRKDEPYENLESPTGLRLAPPGNLKTEIEYNPATGEYDVHERTGAFESRTPYSMSQKEYSSYSSNNSKKKYWRARSKADRTGDNSAYSPSLSAGLDKVLGDNLVDIKPQGSAELTFGGKFNKTFNPALTKQQQVNNTFDFSNKIQMSVTGNIGDKVSLKIKYDSESQFEFENEYKLEYTGDEDEIIKKIEAGTVSFPLNNTLITGSQSLFGIKTELQFGKLYVTSVFSQQKGEFNTVNVEKGAQKQEFEIGCDDYDINKHFFLGYWFRTHYEPAFKTTPQVTNGVIIRRVEIWMTQTSTGKANARNILAVAQLGDQKSGDDYVLPDNKTNKLYKSLKNNSSVRSISQVTGVMSQLGYQSGKDYEKIEQAVKLTESQYVINNKLGYISLKAPVDPSKVLAVAYEYEYRGQVYQVGEFWSDGIAPPNMLIVKMLKGSQLNPRYPNWDLMMKNVYSVGGYQMSGDDFKLDILYEDDRTGKPIGYLPEGKPKGQPLLTVMNLDTITTDNQPYSDGTFDYLEGFTVNSSSGLVIFPVLEPFGSHLEEVFDDKSLSDKYSYDALYDSTQSSARQVAEKNKFILKGSYKSSSSSEISLNSTQVQEGSVTVTAGGRKLVEGVDYTVDYAMGKVKIINQGLLESGTPIKVSSESNPLFNMKTKRLMGTRLEYKFSDNLTVGGTIVKLSETPLTTKVGFDDFPINNTIWGLDGTYTTEAPFITRMVDKLPLISTKEKSTITTTAEFAQLIPGKTKSINDALELDYFENTEKRISLREPGSWVLSSTPQLFKESAFVNNLAYGYNRAQISWFNINQDYFYGTSSDISDDLQSEPYSHPVMETDLFPNRQTDSYYNTPLTMINIGYYPYERGPYNYDMRSSSVDPTTGRLKTPKNRWGGIMREMTTTDFEEANVEYIEFWLMDPFIVTDSTKKKSTGGDLYFNLGMISEDILRDSKKFAENGLKNDTGNYAITSWGRVPDFEVVEKGFDNNTNRKDQDVGLDGWGDTDEKTFFSDYVDHAKRIGLPSSVLDGIYSDPSHDNFTSYLDDRDISNLSIFERYHYYNGVDGNSPTGNNQGTGRLTPDVEDINDDNTLNETESYYQYKVSIRPSDMEVGKNFIVDKVVESVKMPNDNNEKINWYQFKIPINSDLKQSIGSISDFKSIQFMRLFLTNFEDSVYLRMAELGLVRSDWRKYDNAIYEAGEYDLYNDATLDISSVNYEENGQRSPVNYVLPPGVERTIDPMNTQVTEENEASLMLTVEDLGDGNSKAVYKMLNKDLRQFGAIKMFAHAEALKGESSQLDDGDVTAFIRLGSDYTKNYYEYEVPMTLTEHLPDNSYYEMRDDDRLKVWPAENNFVIDLQELVELKEARNKAVAEGNYETYQVYSKQDDNNRISVKGNPNLGNVKTIMLGVRNKKKSSLNTNDDGHDKSVIVWFDELRLTNFNDKGGWAAAASTRITMADFATLSLSGKTIKPGFGGLDQKIFDRSQEELNQYDVASNMALHKFVPEKVGLQLPFYCGWSESFITPLYDPLNPDIKLKSELESLSSDSAKAYKDMTTEYESRLSYNFTNVKINRPNPKFLHPLHINNFSLTYAFNKVHQRDVEYEYQDKYENKLDFMYSYPIKAKNYEPLKSSIKSPQLAIIRDFNFYLLPSQVSFDNEFSKEYKESRRRNLSEYADPDYKFTPVYSKLFSWERIYNVKYNMTKNLRFDYSATNTARVDEPQGKIYHDDTHSAYMKAYRDSVISKLVAGGRTTEFDQKIDATYKLPIDKIKQFDWITSNYKYGGTYNWTRGYELSGDNSSLEAGNEIKNSNSNTLDNNISMTKLYGKSKYLKSLDKKFARGAKQKKNTENVKFNQDKVAIYAYKELEVKHNLKTTDVKLSIIDSKGQLVEGKTKIVDDNTVTFTAEKDYEGANVVVTGKREIKDPAWRAVVDRCVYTLLMVKSVNITGTINNGSYVPGYRHSTKYFGLSDPFDSQNRRPGWAYVFGWVPETDDLENSILSNRWLIDNDALLSEKFSRTYSEQLRVKTNIEPLANLKVTLENERLYSKNNTRFLSNNAETMKTSKRTINGNFSISTNALASNSLLSSSASDDAYANFKANRLIIANKLAKERGGEYELNPKTKYPSYYKSTSQDVLIPAFFAAYTGQDPSKVYTDSYFIPMLRSMKDFLRAINWKVNYSGLTELKPVKKYFKSVNITHSYQCTYSISSYETFTSSAMIDDEFYADLIDGNIYLAPKYNISTVSFNEKLSPIIGIDTKLQNNITTKFEVRNNRTVSLSLVNTEISETGGLEYVFGVGYVFKDVTINIKTGGGTKSYTNDVTTRLDFSIRDNTTIRRTIADDRKHIISGQKIYSAKWYADYQMTERFNIRVFAERTFNKPRTNGYNTRNFSMGATFRFTLI